MPNLEEILTDTLVLILVYPLEPTNQAIQANLLIQNNSFVYKLLMPFFIIMDMFYPDWDLFLFRNADGEEEEDVVVFVDEEEEEENDDDW